MSKGWLSLWREKGTVPAPSGMGVRLPTLVTARDVETVARAEADNRGRLVVGFDTTASRETAWEAFAKPLQDRLLASLPPGLLVALALHGGSRLHTFTRFTSDVGELRDVAAGVRCKAGSTRLLDILDRVVKLRRVGVVLYVGDAFEESRKRARRLADELLLNETRVIILHDGPPPDEFGEITERTGGALLPFNAASLAELGDLLEAIAVLAVGDVELLKAKQPELPAATLLLENLSDRKRIGGRRV